MTSINKDGLNTHGHVYLFAKNHYKVNITQIDALKRILGQIFLLETKFIADSDVSEHLIKLAMDHIGNDNRNIIELIANLNPNHWRYQMYRYKSFDDACISQCLSIIRNTKVKDIKGSLPKPDYFLFFTKDEIINSDSHEVKCELES